MSSIVNMQKAVQNGVYIHGLNYISLSAVEIETYFINSLHVFKPH
jgi:hypothetical protein